ncbi:Dynein heavy chain 17, axonemal [Frankliniella fusca]|uniref:Dynein heavy chain 17, axonemal n=1 Tax=Frankliniella fusca TaxID=407009 RepID=A0AAE1LJC2_9NEOP|nr:Dynein heavy chain 17, axonemal [Frankliniella fusca]
MEAEEGRPNGEHQGGESVLATPSHLSSTHASTQSLELGVSSVDNLTFTKSKIRSDEERLRVMKAEKVSYVSER